MKVLLKNEDESIRVVEARNIYYNKLGRPDYEPTELIVEVSDKLSFKVDMSILQAQNYVYAIWSGNDVNLTHFVCRENKDISITEKYDEKDISIDEIDDDYTDLDEEINELGLDEEEISLINNWIDSLKNDDNAEDIGI